MDFKEDYKNYVGKRYNITPSALKNNNKIKTVKDFLNDIITKGSVNKKDKNFVKMLINGLEKRKKFIQDYEFFEDNMYVYRIVMYDNFTLEYCHTIFVQKISKYLHYNTLSNKHIHYDLQGINDLMNRTDIKPIKQEKFENYRRRYVDFKKVLYDLKHKYDKYQASSKKYIDKNMSIEIEISENNINADINEIINKRLKTIDKLFLNDLMSNKNKWILIFINKEALYIKINDIKCGNVVLYDKAIVIDHIAHKEITLLKNSSIIINEFFTFKKEEQQELDKIYNEIIEMKNGNE